MKGFRTAPAALACMVMAPAAVAAQAPQANAATPAAIAVEQVAIGDPGQQMMLVIWHPAPAPAKAPMDSHAVPLVVISHGTGAGPMAHADTAEALAKAGFVVAAPMHRGDNFQDDSKVGQTDWIASRSRDVGAVIDYMLQQWPGHDGLDGGRVGVFGLSAGATTALVSAGGRLDLGRVAPHCAAHPEFVCKIMAAQADAVPPSWRQDRRIAAAVLAAPGLGFAFGPNGLDSVRIPVQLWVGSADQTVPYPTNAGPIRRRLRGPVEFHEVDNAVHLSFLAPCGPQSPPQICQDNPGFDRAAFHREFNASITAFFRRHLASGSSSRGE